MALIPAWLKAAFLGIFATLVAFVSGRVAGARDESNRQKARDLKAVQRGISGAGKAKQDLRDGKRPEDIAKGNDAKW